MAMTNVRYSGRLPMAFLLLLLFAPSPAFAAKGAPLRCIPEKGTSGVELAKLANATRTDDRFYRQLVTWHGQPSACKGSVGKGEDEGESRLELTWPDGSTFEQSSMLPETSIVRYSNADGLARADEIIAAVRDYAARWGLHIDWTSPHQQEEAEVAGTRVTEYLEPDAGVNGIARLTYDRQQRLVAVSLSMAL
jgi:hypothetical protein